MITSMNVDKYLEKIRKNPNDVDFKALMDMIETHYNFTPTAFDNGGLHNEAGENSGSCKLFSFAKLQGLNKEQTLACFGAYYREDVLKNPNQSNHQNIRHFMKTGWEGIQFDGEPLTPLE